MSEPDRHLTDDQILVLLAEDVNVNEAAETTRHLETCDTCKTKLDEMRGSLDRSRSHKTGLGSEFSHPVDDSVNRAVDGEEQPHAIHAEQDSVPETEVPLSTQPFAWSTHRGQPRTRLAGHFGRYKINEQVGKGGQAAVYRAEDTQLQRTVALKIPLALRDASPISKRRFLQEARAAAALDHPNICRILDVGELDGITYLTMAFVQGEPLNRRGVKDQGIAATVKIVATLARALSEAHRKGVVHRDLKPSNVMVTDVGQPIILDFGLARRDDGEEDRLTKTGSVMGTIYYMSPEQVRGETDKIGPATDIYSLGVILFELISGRLPFTGSTATVLRNIAAEPLPSLTQIRPDLDPKLAAICQKAMAKEIGNRYSSADELAMALERYHDELKDSTDAASGGRIAPLATGQEARGRGMIAAAMFLMVTLSIAAFLYFGRNSREHVQRQESGESRAAAPYQQLPLQSNGTGDVVAHDFIGATPTAESDRPESLSTSIPPTRVSSTIRMQLLFQRASQEKDHLRLVSQYLPLHDEDKVQVQVELETPSYLYVYWFGASGKPYRLWPDPNDESVQQPQRPVTRIQSPPIANGWHTLGGETGMELIVAATSRQPLDENALSAFERYRCSVIATGGERQRDPDKVVISGSGELLRSCVLVLPPGSDHQLVEIAHDAELTTGTDTAPDQTTSLHIRTDFNHVLRSTFDAYYGVVFTHVE